MLRLGKLFFAVIALTASSGCVAVQPWEKGDLANPHMRSDPDRTEAKFIRHVYESKEGTSGGYGVSAGGCGCG